MCEEIKSVVKQHNYKTLRNTQQIKILD